MIILEFIFQLTQKPDEYWNKLDHEALVASGVRLPSEVVPSFYRLKIKADLETLRFTGDVYITIRASKKVKEIVLHSKYLKIGPSPKLTEQIYEKVETVHGRAKRDVEQVSESPLVKNQNDVANATIPSPQPSSNISTEKPTEEPKNATAMEATHNVNSTTNSTKPNVFNDTMNSNSTELKDESKESSPNVTVPLGNINDVDGRRVSLDTQVTTSSVRNIKIISISEASGDRLILTLASALKPNVDYTLELSFQGNISSSMTGFYKSTYKNEKQEERSVIFFYGIQVRKVFSNYPSLFCVCCVINLKSSDLKLLMIS